MSKQYEFFEITPDGEAAIHECMLESDNVIDAEELFLNRLSKNRLKPSRQGFQPTSYEEADYGIAEVMVHLNAYAFTLGPKEYKVFETMSGEQHKQLFRRAYKYRLDATRQQQSDSKMDLLSAYTQWINECVPPKELEEAHGFTPGHVRRFANRMPGYVAEAWPHIMPGHRLGRIAASNDDNVIRCDFRVAVSFDNMNGNMATVARLPIDRIGSNVGTGSEQ